MSSNGSDLAVLGDLAREVEELAMDLNDLTGDPASAKAAFNRFVVHGMPAMHRAEVKVLSVGSDPGGGFWAPAQQASQILGVIRETSGLVARCLSVTAPVGTSSWSTNLLTAGLSAEWLGENQPLTAITTGRFGAVDVEIGTVSVLLWASRKWLEDAVDSVEVLTRDAAEAIALKLEEGVVNGSGTHAEPLGLLRQTGSFVRVASGASAILLPRCLRQAWLALPEQFARRGVWVMARSTLAAILEFSDSAGMPLFLPTRETDDGPAMLFGRPIELCASMPTISASSWPVLFLARISHLTSTVADIRR
jgi:HK97 family phage major capsid protein